MRNFKHSSATSIKSLSMMKPSLIILSLCMTTMPCFADNHQLPNNALVDSPNISKGRLLASNCFQCHATQGSGGFEALLNTSQTIMFAELMKERFKTKPKIMAVHAQGYTKEQLWDLSGYLASINVTVQR